MNWPFEPLPLVCTTSTPVFDGFPQPIEDYSRKSKDSYSTDLESSKQRSESSLSDQQEKSKPSQAEPAEESDPTVVQFDGPDDPEHPQNWSSTLKWMIALITGFLTFTVTFASSVFSSAIDVTAEEYGVPSEVTTLGVSLFVLGFAFGPIIYGPLSELYGRRIPLYAGYFAFGIMQIPVAVAQNIQTIMICRFIGGFFGAAPAIVVGGLMADIFPPVTRTLGVTVFCVAAFIGPVTGPIIGGFVTQSYLGWRWTAWLTMIMWALFGSLAVIILPESYAPVILEKKARRLRFETKNWALHAKTEESPIDFYTLIDKYLERPFKMLALEPILVLMSLYISFVYGLLYLFFEVFPISFQEQRGWNLGVGALPFISIMIGVCLGASITATITLTRTKRIYKRTGELVPEESLIPMMIGGTFMPIGLFWFAWTSNPDITPWPQIISCIPIGAGVQMIFLQGMNYLIDVYLVHANSALTANTVMRSWVGAGLPLAAQAMFGNLGVPWATSTLGFISLVLFPVPILFYIYGAKIRSLSKYSPYD